MRSGGLCQLKIPMTPSGIEPSVTGPIAAVGLGYEAVRVAVRIR